jgi:hypothetical protein
MNTNIETTTASEFGFDEYIMPTTYSTMPTKLESYDSQLYPSGTCFIKNSNKIILNF